MRFVVSGGGTGGHIYPAVSIAQVLGAGGHQVLYMGGHASPEEELAETYGFDFAAVTTAPLHRHSLKIATDLLHNAKGMQEAKALIKDFGADAAIGTGGFVTAPVLAAAQSLHIPTIIHEQNAYPGLANRRLSKKTAAVCLTFPAAAQYFPTNVKLYHTGLPVRENIINTAADMENMRQEAYQYFAIPKEKHSLPTLLVTGGSQGAQSINQTMAKAYDGLLKAGYRILHLCGKKNYADLRSMAPEHEDLILMPYLEKMEYAMAIADAAVARSGASFLAEAAVLGLPLVLIPYPHATNDHQTANARQFEEAGGACIIADGELRAKILIKAVQGILEDEAKKEKMRAGSLRLAKTAAAEEIAGIVINTVSQ